MMISLNRQEYDDLMHTMRNRITSLRGAITMLCCKIEQELAQMETKLNELSKKNMSD